MTFFECYADESLLKSFGLTSKELTGGHSFGRSKVSQRLKRSSDSVGLIDEDPGASRDQYLNHLFQLKPDYQDNNLTCISDRKLRNRLIVIRPNLESWTVKLAIEKNLDLANLYGLSMQPSKLHEILAPKENSKARDNLKQFINDVSSHQSIIKLREFLKK